MPDDRGVITPLPRSGHHEVGEVSQPRGAATERDERRVGVGAELFGKATGLV